MKDDSLPYVYLDEDDEAPRRKKTAKPAAGRTASAQSAGVKKKELPYVYLDDDEEPKRKKTSAARKGAQKGTSARRPAQKKAAARRLQKKSAAPVIIALCLVLLIALGGVGALEYFRITDLGIRDLIFGVDTAAKPRTVNTPIVGGTPGASATGEMSTVSWFTPEDRQDDQLNLADGNSIRVSAEQLSVTQGLNAEWLNVLLLGTDSRALNEPSRSDTMMICSINQSTGQVKLTSLMRDTAVEINGRTVKLNTAFFYGGPNLAMKTVNEYFGMNIEKYVVVNFSGFAKIVDALGGVEMDISEAELPLLNHNVGEQYYLLFKFGEMEEEAAKAKYYDSKLESAGKNIHLDGNQALAYARIRKSDNDYTRTERQRKVLMALLNKMKGTDSGTVITLFYDNIGYVSTNLELGTIPTLASLVLAGNGMSNEDTFRLPVQGSYKEEVRNNVSMLYDMKTEENRRALFMFIYGN